MYVVIRNKQLFGGNFQTIAEAKAWAKRNASKGMYHYAIAGSEPPFTPLYTATFCLGMRFKWDKKA